MNDLVNLQNDYGLEIKKDIAYVSSLYVAEFLGKRHTHVLDSIKKILSDDSGYSKEFTQPKFRLSKYKDNTGKSNKMYLLDRDGFMLLVMSYNTPTANKVKEMYIKRFNEMEKLIEQIKFCRADYPQLTQNIKRVHADNLKPYHFSNESDMINRIVLGMTAKEFKQKNNLDPKTASIRPYLSEEQLYAIDKLQLLDSGLILGVSDYNTRKTILRDYYHTEVLSNEH